MATVLWSAAMELRRRGWPAAKIVVDRELLLDAWLQFSYHVAIY